MWIEKGFATRDDVEQGSLLGCILWESRVAADLIKKVLAFPLSSLNFKGLSFCFEGLTYVYMLLTFSFQCHFRFILINILVPYGLYFFKSNFDRIKYYNPKKSVKRTSSNIQIGQSQAAIVNSILKTSIIKKRDIF